MFCTSRFRSLWLSLAEWSAKHYGFYIPLSLRPLSSTPSYISSEGSSCFLRELPPVSLILCFRKSTKVNLKFYIYILSLINIILVIRSDEYIYIYNSSSYNVKFLRHCGLSDETTPNVLMQILFLTSRCIHTDIWLNFQYAYRTSVIEQRST